MGRVTLHLLLLTVCEGIVAHRCHSLQGDCHLCVWGRVSHLHGISHSPVSPSHSSLTTLNSSCCRCFCRRRSLTLPLSLHLRLLCWNWLRGRRLLGNHLERREGFRVPMLTSVSLLSPEEALPCRDSACACVACEETSLVGPLAGLLQELLLK